MQSHILLILSTQTFRTGIVIGQVMEIDIQIVCLFLKELILIFNILLNKVLRKSDLFAMGNAVTTVTIAIILSP